ncbi:DUF3085 domain-containing protein [Nocardia sp. NBC_01730]|uniref:DUF3085 domain-containing protein n=1 Tax=Nocardia sp. NBC_01730 TaxID=2975998 RepID=UPI002E15B2EF|nr:DUF3085 domain-containing protein [Nocardia sp. NBC_01730]
MASIELWFPLAEVGPIAEHAMTAQQHSRSPYEPADAPAVPSLVWSKDSGTYLRSNGIPRQLPDSRQPDGMTRIVYAQGWGPGTESRLADTPVGGDDFTEYLDLTEILSGGTTLAEAIHTCALLGGWMLFTVRAGQLDIGFAPTKPN